MSPTTPTDFGSLPPPLTRSSTVPAGSSTGGTNSTNNSNTNVTRQDRSHLAPEDAFLATSPPRRPIPSFPDASTGADHRAARAHLRHGAAAGDRSRSRRTRKRTWKKLMWVKQSYPDNYTDQDTFLESLQRNPRLQPYDFWPLVADSTVIVQHVCSVIIFIVCFVLIQKQRVPPTSVVSFSSLATFLGWLLWERWEADEERKELSRLAGGATVAGRREPSRRTGSSMRRPPPHADDTSAATTAASSLTNLSAAATGATATERPARHSHSASVSSLISNTSTTSQSAYRRHSQEIMNQAPPRRSSFPLPGDDNSRLNQRLSTVKSAILIYSTLLGLSPILKSLTKSTSPDSIWAMSFWLLTINIFFFDYSGGVRVNIPASLSTNAALMASTVLASRLPSTGQVFSLTLFSIEVFGLFPVFRRYARHRSSAYNYAMTALLVLGAGAGVGVIMGDDGSGAAAAGGWPWKSAVAGMVVSVLISAVAMGGCSWWLIGLQKYKNEIYGPWDQARPIIMSRRLWEDG
ncbi:phosphatidylinositol N-acetylglucosaminyltransferase [Colletotrichum zoysiae]|uniref:Phosphatidylinositol N-acetylglucosaminyltransferase n=1 Tax=Colletotrichum zoysiae TaxID=1216348 RepID=A0AAD9HPH8_9PEZI|nr:phosphatidylinositol N-acetylglucosaminyltransferase [Colletotrichum zoysiae]